ncbi:class I SAM-dependent methyltransferase [Micromonospora ureilytica]|uniref:SAM-dependent methyltransferase n=1 Tax=Micromonospora ureilytica TaxID=709868 RepID=A0ABS0JCS9_9ACTN|nr:SAM-dependent methyltransferase [Micromonospora ureilytica]
MTSAISLDGFDVVLGRLGRWAADQDACGTPVAPMPPARPDHWLVHTDGRRDLLPVRRWHGPPEPAIESIAARCTGPTIDLGCGPGRLTRALAQRGLVALGVDISAEAVRLTQGRGVVALRRDIFEPLPGEGRWAHALLIDGNIGIGGDPVGLLRRCGALIAADGTLVVEVEPPGTGLWRGQAYVLSGSSGEPEVRGPAFRWARVGTDAVARTAADAGLRVADRFRLGSRWFAELAHS